MSPVLLFTFLSIFTQEQPAAVSSPTTDSVSVPAWPVATSQPTDATIKPFERDDDITSEIPPPWEFLFGYQDWQGQGNAAFGFSEGIHEIRLIGPGSGIYIDYKASLLHAKKMRFNAGGMIGGPSIIGGHVGVHYRTGGDSFWGRIGVGFDGGVSCSRNEGANECSPAGGINLGIYFSPSDF